MYKIIGADGKEYGPVTLDQLRAWIDQGRVNSQTRIQEAGATEWKTASQFPELTAAMASPNPRLGTAMAPAGPSPIPGLPAQPQQGLAITSLVLGILSFICLGPLTAIPAIICGHIAHSRARREPAIFGGAGLAIAGFVLGYVNLAICLLVMPAMLLPALAKAKQRAQEINCVNNLKQVGLAFKVWELDHGDQYPFNVSTNTGGTAELSARGSDGFERNALLNFMVLSNELSTPKILICPADSGKVAAWNFVSLQAANLSYRLRSGTNVSDAHPMEVLAVCPIHGTELMCDGSVQRRPRR
jgi:hypothetical protein